ncbi:unnamed protein product [Cuscuta epithymum]|uniref:Uncharacterized protein n=1 Tax=Cuscuta epithymum TaxID=186058 RepID=A0AAV0DZZ6_9ASTE|nr:unnamed protein product [Cuscuta epithymum]
MPQIIGLEDGQFHSFSELDFRKSIQLVACISIEAISVLEKLHYQGSGIWLVWINSWKQLPGYLAKLIGLDGETNVQVISAYFCLVPVSSVCDSICLKFYGLWF